MRGKNFALLRVLREALGGSHFAETEGGDFLLQGGFGFWGDHIPGDVVDGAVEGIQQIQTGSGLPGLYQAIRFHHPHFH